MARKPRFNLIGVPQHIVQRGNNREPCFYALADYHRYLEDLKESASRNQCAVHAYVLMTNHVHILVTPFNEHGISHMMQDLGRNYVRYINYVYKRTGTLWEGRYKSGLVDSEKYLLTCMRYIELNPVRAGMVQHPGDYAWSSYSCNAFGKPDSLDTEHPLYIELGSEEDQRQYAYRKLFSCSLDPDEIHSIRESLNKELVLGRVDLKRKIEQMTKRQTMPAQMGRPRIEEDDAYYVIF